METSKQLSSNIRKGIVHAIVAIIALKTLSIPYAFVVDSFDLMKWELYGSIVIVLAFYLHSLFILPILTLKEQVKKYLSFTIPLFFVFTYLIVLFEAMKSSQMVTTVDGVYLPVSHFFFQTEWLFGGLVVGLASFVPFSLCSLLYHVFLINAAQRKKLASFKYSEAVVNAIIVLSLLLFTLVRSTNFMLAGIYNALQMILFLSVFYFNVFFLVPKLLLSKRILTYMGLNVLSFGVILLSAKLISGRPIEKFLPYSQNFSILVVILFIILMVSFVYGYVRVKFKSNERLFDLQLNAKESELQLLKSQVNPHFLFNTLNTLYATALKEDAPKTAQSIAKLGSLIRYMQNDIHKDLIPLQKEVDYLKDYIEIQKLRIAVTPDIQTSFENIGSQVMSPGLFIPLVENAFKYGIHPTEKSTIQIEVRYENGIIHFRCENAYNNHQKVHHREEGFGIGIKNVRQRLELVYPKRYHFDIDQTDDTFIVELTLQINKA